MNDKYVKYPRTPHLPWSVGTSDDRTLKNDSHFIGKRVIATIKMDGENTTIYNDYIHARSIDSESHPSQSWVRGLQGTIGYLLDDDMRVCGENLYAKHTIKYENLNSYFQGYSFWKGETCYNWDDTLDLFEFLHIEPVKTFYEGIYEAKEIHKRFEELYPKEEGYVIRLADSFPAERFMDSMAKYVQPEFRQAINDSDKHWRDGKIERNELIKNERTVKDNK